MLPLHGLVVPAACLFSGGFFVRRFAVEAFVDARSGGWKRREHFFFRQASSGQD